MAGYQVENQWGGDSAPWHEGGTWELGGRADQKVVAVDIKSDDSGQNLKGTITYSGEGAISFWAQQAESNEYVAGVQWGGDTAEWYEDDIWVIGSREDQKVVAMNVQSTDGGQTLLGTITYNGESAIGFKGVEVPKEPSATAEPIQKRDYQTTSFWRRK